MKLDDLDVGQHVTVLSWKPREGSDTTIGMEKGTMPSVSFVRQDASYVGDLLRVEAVDLPFIRVTLMRTPDAPETSSGKERRITLDTRRVTLKKLRHDFVQAYTDTAAKKKD